MPLKFTVEGSAEQECFELTLEAVGTGLMTNVFWQSVPCLQTSIREAPSLNSFPSSNKPFSATAPHACNTLPKMTCMAQLTTPKHSSAKKLKLTLSVFCEKI